MNPAQAVTLQGEDRALFASDVHLDERDPATADLFFGMLEREVPRASHLFLLGDIFEAWVGDDDDSDLAGRAAGSLSRLASAGTRVFLMRGNRDFLLDVPLPADPDARIRFSLRTGATMLDDPCLINLFGRPTLLSHGDALCIDDERYQAFRRQTREPGWQRSFLAQSLQTRLATARAMRERSESEKGMKSDELMDVNPGEVERLMREYGALLMIHGHTHRPATHRLSPDGHLQRWVLPDWDAARARGGMLLASAQGLERLGNWG